MSDDEDKVGKPLVAVRDLREGDLIDLAELPYFDTLDEADRMVAEDQYAQVGSEGGPRTWETPFCVVLHTDQGSFGLPPDHEFTVAGRTLRESDLPTQTAPIVEQLGAADLLHRGLSETTVASYLQIREQYDKDLLDAARNSDSYAFKALDLAIRLGTGVEPDPYWIRCECAQEAFDRGLITVEELGRIINE